ncbi:MAG: efflux RND transporter periplasmic adaptor subunit [Casimicrobiaceae bacterium]
MCPLIRVQWRSSILRGVVAASALCALAATAGAAAMDVRVASPIASRKVVVSTAFGTVETSDHVVLVAPFDGFVKGVSARSGNVVRAGSVLLQIQPLTLASQVRVAAADVAAAKADLVQKNILAEQKLVTAAALETTRAQLVAREAALVALRAELRLGALRAPFAGTVEQMPAEGTRVLRGQLLLRINGNGALRIEAAFPMAAARGLRPGASLTVNADGESGMGQVYSVANAANRYGLVSVYLNPPPALRLLPGEVVRVGIDGTATAGAWRVPRAAVVLRGTAARVFVDQGGRAHAIAVTLVAVDAGNAVVLGALRPDSHVIVSDVAWLHDGTPVALKPAGPGS